jgi:hypothetical protein
MARKEKTSLKPHKSGQQKLAPKKEGHRAVRSKSARVTGRGGAKAGEALLRKFWRQALMARGEGYEASARRAVPKSLGASAAAYLRGAPLSTKHFKELLDSVLKTPSLAPPPSHPKRRVTTITREVIRIRGEGRLTDRLIARATGAALGTVQDWLALRAEPSGVRADRIAELGAIVERLTHVIEPDYIAVWLVKPLAALDDEKPIDVLRRGESVRVARLISSLEDSGAA